MGNCLFDSLNVFVQLASSAALRAALCDYVDAHRAQFVEAIRFANLGGARGIADAGDAAVAAAAQQATQMIDAGRAPDDAHVVDVLQRMTDLYLVRMRRNGVDGDHVMLAACALAYDMRIDVSWPRTGKHAFSEGRSDAPRVAAISWVPGHYTAVRSVAKQTRAPMPPPPPAAAAQPVNTRTSAPTAAKSAATRTVSSSMLRRPPPPVHAVRSLRVPPTAHHRHAACARCQHYRLQAAALAQRRRP